ncbi:hypothetical protein [Amycolatopsis sp. H20-H5]|uniref:hypothetical protein n=1 Tax=Amycolatopsis sp. H20-H5 TaxID=3046309 RepID=UPI002DB9B496|nr:hypothetical protein [Amycolatopsis sp. H20-H5]MEC3976997.1 hypothetical protein [Amycolatopsis sp. H20-H5]
MTSVSGRPLKQYRRATTAKRLASLGTAVALLFRRAEHLDEIVHDITVAGGTAIAVPVDVTDASTLMSGAPARHRMPPGARTSRSHRVRRRATAPRTNVETTILPTAQTV